MRQLWADKLEWDQEISEEMYKVWIKLYNDLVMLNKLQFPRFALNSEDPVSFYVFSDASILAYGFIIYAVQNGKSNMVFAKGKVSPMQKKSLPTLELLGAHLAMKSLFVILNTYCKLNFKDIVLSVDSQVVLNWLLSDVNSIKTKNIFAKNRVKEICKMKTDINDKYNVEIKYKYIKTDSNPADMLTRGMSFDKFQNNFDYWQHGPEWLNKTPLVFPISDLKCLTADQKTLVQTTILKDDKIKEIQPVIPFERYSDFNKLVRITSCVFRFINKLKKRINIDDNNSAKIHLIKTMQSQVFG